MNHLSRAFQKRPHRSKKCHQPECVKHIHSDFFEGLISAVSHTIRNKCYDCRCQKQGRTTLWPKKQPNPFPLDLLT